MERGPAASDGGWRDATYRIPIFEPGVRSLNLANAVSIVLYEALRQSGILTEPRG